MDLQLAERLRGFVVIEYGMLDDFIFDRDLLPLCDVRECAGAPVNERLSRNDLALELVQGEKGRMV